MTLIHTITLICALELIWFLNSIGTVIAAKTTQPSSMDCAEEEDVNLPCNNYTIGGNDYIHSYQQNPNQSPQYVIMAYEALWTAAWPLWTQLPTESAAPWSCPRSPWETPLCTTASWETHTGTDGAAPLQCFSGGKKGGHSGGAVMRANLESSGKRVREQ